MEQSFQIYKINAYTSNSINNMIGYGWEIKQMVAIYGESSIAILFERKKIPI